MMARTQARMHAIASPDALPCQMPPAMQQSKHDAHVKRGVQQGLTTMPMSDLVLSSTVLSSTRFMNWSNPRSVPVTCRLAFSATACTACGRMSVQRSRPAHAQRGEQGKCARQDRA